MKEPTKISDVPGAVAVQIDSKKVPCGRAVAHNFFGADGQLVRRDCTVVVDPALFPSIAKAGDL
jgi:hypothetical protein